MGEISRSAWPPPSWAHIKVSILIPSLRGGREQLPASPVGREPGGPRVFAGFLAFLLQFHTFPSSLSATWGWPQLLRGSCHPPPCPTTFFCPPKPTVVPAVPCWGLWGARDGVISLGSLSPNWLEGSVPSNALSLSSFACLIWVPAWGTRLAAGSGGCQAGRVAMPQQGGSAG